MRYRRTTVLLVAGCALIAASQLVSLFTAAGPEAVARRAGKNIGQKLAVCRESLTTVLSGDSGIAPAAEHFYESRRLGIYFFTNDSLVYWNNSRIPIKQTAALFSDSEGVVRLADGYYLYSRRQSDRRAAVALASIKSEYPVQNAYLRNDFRDWTGIPEGMSLSTEKGSMPVEVGGKVFFFLSGNELLYSDGDWDLACLLLFFTGTVFVLISSLMFLSRHKGETRLAWVVVAVLAFRLLMLACRWPGFIYRTRLYDLRLFGNADSWLNTNLGDLVFNALIWLFAAVSLRFLFHAAAQKQRTIAFACIAVVIVLITQQFNATLISLVHNSTLNFDVLNIFNITLPAWIGLGTIALLAVSLFVASNTLLELYGKKELPYVFIAAIIVASASLLAAGADAPVEWIWPVPAGLCIWLLARRTVTTPVALGLYLIVASAFSAAILSRLVDINRQNDIQVLSIRLAERQDPVLESEYVPIPERISGDKALANLIGILPATAEAIQELLSQRYFSEYFRRYNIEYALFDERCTPMLDVKQPLLLNEGYLQDQISYHSDSTAARGLWFVRNYHPNARYIGLVPIGRYRLYTVMEPKQLGEPGSFPDLLLDQSQQRHEKLKNLSYAVYRGRERAGDFGSLNYPQLLPDSATLATHRPGYDHRFHSPDEFTTVVTSTPERTAGNFFTFNSYLLLLYSLVSYGAYFLYARLFTDRLTESSLARRIQGVIITLLLLSMTAVGLISGKLVTSQFQEENKKELAEKSAIIINELTGAFGAPALFESAQTDAVHQKLTGYARLFNADISLFDTRGYLHTTSQPRMYGLGLAAALANPAAMRELRTNVSSAVTVNERAGTLNYLSHYAPVFGSSRKIEGYVNLPYFARQNDLVNELSGIISGLVNVYVILFVLSMVAGLVLSGYITQPLRLIQQQIARISLGGSNEKIGWRSRDEIGRLVEEYNLMLVKLEESALLLARSERESAWREMARQVAHEIKNPLTPMKLSLQHLQHLAKSDPAAFRERFEKAGPGIIEQIDSLANIASEFSHFAKLPVTRLSKVNLCDVIDTAVQTFAGREEVKIVNNLRDVPFMINADREQCLRVFNNILSNAIQAVEDSMDPTITIDGRIENNEVIVSVRDNGSGISDDLKPKIFSPSFTTKSTGSGLGLAMVKSIMEGLGGRVWFESEEGKGTIFHMTFVKSE
jgi:two-component system, NtrC family, nitrogen regulation sensor histidine kinase NtrY